MLVGTHAYDSALLIASLLIVRYFGDEWSLPTKGLGINVRKACHSLSPSLSYTYSSIGRIKTSAEYAKDRDVALKRLLKVGQILVG